MNYGQVIELLKRGSNVARGEWNGKGMFISLNKGSFDREVMGFSDGVSMGLFEAGDAGTVTRLPNLNMRAASGATVTGWLASQTDMLAEDWVEA